MGTPQLTDCTVALAGADPNAPASARAPTPVPAAPKPAKKR